MVCVDVETQARLRRFVVFLAGCFCGLVVLKQPGVIATRLSRLAVCCPRQRCSLIWCGFVRVEIYLDVVGLV